jgi:hypothetical protein
MTDHDHLSETLMNRSILWRGVYLPGHEACRVYQVGTEWRLEGTAVLLTDDRRPCQLSYLVRCDANWQTLSGSVSGWVGNDNVNIELAVDTLHHWQLNGLEKPAVNGCLDLDLNFSPSTNLLPIRRLNLAVGQHAEVKAAWLRFPSFELEPLTQVYLRLDESIYRYSSNAGKFVRDITVNDVGLVTDYPGIWRAETEVSRSI